MAVVECLRDADADAKGGRPASRAVAHVPGSLPMGGLAANTPVHAFEQPAPRLALRTVPANTSTGNAVVDAARNCRTHAGGSSCRDKSIMARDARLTAATASAPEFAVTY